MPPAPPPQTGGGETIAHDAHKPHSARPGHSTADAHHRSGDPGPSRVEPLEPRQLMSVTGTATGNAHTPEGSSNVLNLSASASNGPSSVVNWTVNWGDGTTPVTYSGSPSSVSHLYTDGTSYYTIAATVTADEGASQISTYSCFSAVTVDDVPPDMAFYGANSTDEGSTYSISPSYSDVGQDTVSSWSINWGDGSATETYSGSPSMVSHVYADGYNTYGINGTLTNEDGTFSFGTKAITVNNVTPSVSLSGNSHAYAGATYTLFQSHSDPGQDTVSRWDIDWGDGQTQSVTGNPGSFTHVYSSLGPKNINVSPVDEDGTYSFSYGTTVVPNLLSMEVTNTAVSSEDETASDLNGSPLTLTRNNYNQTDVSITGQVNPSSQSSQAVYAVFTADGSTKLSDIANGMATLDWAIASGYEIMGGIDLNANGLLDSGEQLAAVPVNAEQLTATVSSNDASFDGVNTFTVTRPGEKAQPASVDFTVTVTDNNNAGKQGIAVHYNITNPPGQVYTAPGGIVTGGGNTGASGILNQTFSCYFGTTGPYTYNIQILDANGTVLGTFKIKVQ